MTEKANPSSSRPIEAFKTAGAIAYGGSPEGYIPDETTEIAIQDGSITESNLNQFAETSSGSSLDVTIDGGEAFVFGSWICIDTQTTVSLNASTTGQTVYVGWNKDGSDDVIIGLDSAFSSASGDADQKISLWEFDTDGSGVTSSTDLRSFDQFSADNIEQGDGSGLDADSVDGFDKTDLDSLYVDESGDSMSGPLQLGGNLSAIGGETIWDELASYIPQGRLENDSLTVAGNSVSLGGSTAVNHNNLSNISSDDHHTKTSSASELIDVSPDSNSSAHHSRYDNSEAINAINNDTDHGSTAQHNYFSGSHNDLSDIGSSDHHTKTSSASELTDVSPDSVSSAHHSRYDDSEAISSINNDTDHGSTASHNYFSGSHNDLSNIGSSDHHTRYSDEEAQDAIGSILNSDFVYDDAGNEILLSNNSVTVAGNTVSLGSSTPIDHSDLSNIGSADHHTRYSDEEAQDAIAGPFLTAGNGINKEYLDNSNELTLEIAANSIRENELDESITPTWTGEHTFSSGIDLSGGAITDSLQDHLDLTGDGNNLRLSTGQAIEDEAGDKRLELPNNGVRVFGDNDYVFEALDGRVRNRIQAGSTWEIEDLELGSVSVSYSTGSSTGTLDLSNSNLLVQSGSPFSIDDPRFLSATVESSSDGVLLGADPGYNTGGEGYVDIFGGRQDADAMVPFRLKNRFDGNTDTFFELIGLNSDGTENTKYVELGASITGGLGTFELTNANLSIPGALEADKSTGDLSIAGTLTENASL